MARGEGQRAEEGLAALPSGRRSLLGSKNRLSKGSPSKQEPSLKEETLPAREGSERQGAVAGRPAGCRRGPGNARGMAGLKMDSGGRGLWGL